MLNANAVNKAIKTLEETRKHDHPPDFKEALSIAIDIMENYLCSACGQSPDDCLCDKEEY